MYEEYYHLREKPFSLLPDPEFLYLGEQHSMALHALRYGVMDQVGFVVVTGEIGCGKTILVRQLLKELADDTTFGLISNTHRMQDEVVERVLMAFNADYAGTSNTQLYRALVDFLAAEHAQNHRTLLIIDEAQNITAGALEELRLLSNVNADKDQLLQIILLGQPELRDTLLQSNLVQFAQRIAVHIHLKPLDAMESCAFIRHRLECAGGNPGLITDEACQRVHHFSEGIPRIINRLCDLALVYGYGMDKSIVEADLIDTVFHEAGKGGLLGGPGTNATLSAPVESKPPEVHRPVEFKTSDTLASNDSQQTQNTSSEETVSPTLEEAKSAAPPEPRASDSAPILEVVDGMKEQAADAAAAVVATVEADLELEADQPSGQPITGEQEEVPNSTTDFLQNPAPAESFDAPVQTVDEPHEEHRATRWRNRILTTVALAAIGLTVSAAVVHEQYDVKALWTEYVKNPLLEFTTSSFSGMSSSSPPVENDVVADSAGSQVPTPAQAQQPDGGPGAGSEPSTEENSGTLQPPSLAEIASLTQTHQVAEPDGSSATTEITRLLEVAARQQRNGRLEEALTTVEQAMEIDRQHADVRSMQADVVQAELVRKIAERTRQQAEHDEHNRRLATINEAIQVNLDTGNLEDAELLIAEGLIFDPNDERLAALQAEFERQQEASEQEKLRSKLAELREQVLRHERNGQTREALELIDHARELAPNDPEIAALKNRLDNTLAQQAREQEEERQRLLEIRRLINEATQARNSGELADALASIDQALAIDSSHPALTDSRAVLVEAIAERDRTRQEKARQRRELEKAAAQIEQHLEADELEAATSLLDQKLTEYPQHERLNALRTNVENALVERERKLAEQARREREEEEGRQRLLEIRRLVNEATQARNSGELADALALIDQALAIDSSHPELSNSRADLVEAIAERDRTRQAEARQRRELEKATAQIEQYLEAGGLEAATSLLDQKLSEYPRHERLNALRTGVDNALAEREQKRAEQARRERETAQLLAAARREQQAGDLTAAISLIGQGLQIEPNHPELIGLRQEVADLAAQERRRLENTEATARVVEQELKSGDLEGAMTLLDQHLAENPQDERLAAFRTEVENALEQRERSRAEQAKPRTLEREESSKPAVESTTSSLEQEKEVKTEPNAQSQGESPTALAEEYMRLGNTMLERGDVASARLFYQSAVEEGHERAMIAVGSTYDPVAIKLRGLVVHTNPVEAAEWYQRAARRGYAEANEHLDALRRWFADHKHTLEATEATALENALTRP